MRRILTVLCLVLLTAAACTDDAGPPEQVEDGLVVGTTDALGPLDPATCYDATCAYTILPNTHEGLTRIGPDLGVQPALATDWEVSPDGLRHTFRLREGVTFHDGTPFDAEAMRFSLERVRRIDAGASFLLFDTRNDPPAHGIAGIETPDPGTLVLTLAAPDARLAAKLAFPVASAVSPEAYPADEPAARDVLVGTGPFAASEVGEGSIELARFDGYHGDEAASEAVTLRRFEGPAALRVAISEGDAHLGLRRWTPSEIEDLEGTSGVEVVTTPEPTIRFLAFNATLEPYDDVNVRRAIAATVDRSALVEGPLSGSAEPLYSLVPPAYGVHRPVFEDGLDPQAAYEAAELSQDDPLPLELWYAPTHYGESEDAVARELEAMLEGSGVFDVSLRTAAWPDLKASMARGEPGMTLLGWFPDVLDPGDYLSPFLGSANARALGTNYASEDADLMVLTEQTTTGFQERVDALVGLQELARDDVPYVPLWQPLRAVAVGEGVEGFEPHPSSAIRLGGVAP